MNKVVHGLRGTALGAILLIRHGDFAATFFTELRITMIEDVKVISNNGDANYAYYSLVQIIVVDSGHRPVSEERVDTHGC